MTEQNTLTNENTDATSSADADSAGQGKETSYVSYDEFKKMDMRVGTIRFVESIDGADKLLRCLVQFDTDVATQTFTDEAGNEYPVRQIVSGIREYFPDIQSLVGKTVLYIINLEPRMIKGVESQGMLMAVGDGAPIFLVPEVSEIITSRVR